MYLNAYQRYMISLVKEYGPLKQRQIEYMANLHFERKLPNLDGYIRQLCQFGDFQRQRYEGEMYVGYKGDTPDPIISDAFEVMMQFGSNVVAHHRGKDLAAICFLVRAKEQTKEVCVLPVVPGDEYAVTAFAEDSSFYGNGRLVIFLIARKEQMRSVRTKENHKFALVGGGTVIFFEK